MTRRTRAWLGVIALVVVFGTATLASVRVGALTGSASVLEPARDEVRVQLPGRGGRLTLLVGSGSWLPLDCKRHVTLERAGQAVIDTPVFPAPLDGRFGIALYWIDGEGRDGPYLRLADPAGDLLLDLRRFQAWRVTAHDGEPWLTKPTGAMAMGYVATETGAHTMTVGRPLDGVAARPGRLLGRVLPGPDGALWQPASEAVDAPS